MTPTSVLAILLGVAALDADDGKLLVTAAIDARKQIHSGRIRVVLTRHSEKPGVNAARGGDARQEFDVCWGLRQTIVRCRMNMPTLRADKIPPGMPRDPDIADPQINRRLRDAGALFDADQRADILVLPDVAYAYRTASQLILKTPDGVRSHNITFIDPMLIGVALASQSEEWMTGGLEAVLAVNETEWTVESNPGGDAVRIVNGRRQLKSQVTVNRIWIDPKRNFSIVRRELALEGKPPLSWLTADLKEIAKGCWYPSRVERIVTHEGKPASSSVIEVTEMGCNPTIDDTEFALTKLDVPRGTEVFEDREKRVLGTWNGTEIVAAAEPKVVPLSSRQNPKPPPPVVATSGSRPETWLWIIASSAAVLAGAVFVLRRRAA